MSSEELMTVPELAAFLRKPVDTIYRWNSRGGGPRYMKVGTTALYRRADVDAWLTEKYVDAGRGAA